LLNLTQLKDTPPDREGSTPSRVVSFHMIGKRVTN
jgi:hypothetical protein